MKIFFIIFINTPLIKWKCPTLDWPFGAWTGFTDLILNLLTLDLLFWPLTDLANLRLILLTEFGQTILTFEYLCLETFLSPDSEGTTSEVQRLARKTMSTRVLCACPHRLCVHKHKGIVCPQGCCARVCKGIVRVSSKLSWTWLLFTNMHPGLA